MLGLLLRRDLCRCFLQRRMCPVLSVRCIVDWFSPLRFVVEVSRLARQRGRSLRLLGGIQRGHNRLRDSLSLAQWGYPRVVFEDGIVVGGRNFPGRPCRHLFRGFQNCSGDWDYVQVQAHIEMKGSCRVGEQVGFESRRSREDVGKLVRRDDVVMVDRSRRTSVTRDAFVLVN